MRNVLLNLDSKPGEQTSRTFIVDQQGAASAKPLISEPHPPSKVPFFRAVSFLHSLSVEENCHQSVGPSPVSAPNKHGHVTRSHGRNSLGSGVTRGQEPPGPEPTALPWLNH